MPSAFLPWQDAQPTSNSALPLAMVAASLLGFSAEAGASMEYTPPLASSAATSTAGAAYRLRRRVESRAEILRVSSRTTVLSGPGYLIR